MEISVVYIVTLWISLMDKRKYIDLIPSLGPGDLISLVISIPLKITSLYPVITVLIMCPLIVSAKLIGKLL